MRPFEKILACGLLLCGACVPVHAGGPPEDWWAPVIALSGFIIYRGSLFPAFRGDGFIGGLASQALIRIEFDGRQGQEAARYAMGARIREVEEGPNDVIWVLEAGSNAALRRLMPR